MSIQASPPVLLPLLLKCVKDPDETVRKLSQDAAEAVFRQNADDVEDDRRDRERRFGEIPRERLDFAFTLGLLRPLLADQSSRVQLTALHCLSELEERGLPLRSALVPLLGEAQDADVRSTAAQILLRLDPEAHDAPAEAARALIGQLGVSEPDILLETHDEQLPLDGFAGARKARLRTALGAGLARPLMAIIERHDQERMYLAIRGLEEMGPQAQPAAPVLEKLVDKDTQYWDEAACALASVDRKRRQYLPKLRGMYEENDGWPRFVFAFALSYYGPAAAHVLPTLRQGPGREQVRFEPERVEAAIARIEARAGAREAGP